MERLDPPLDPARDHTSGASSSPTILLEYGSYGCPACHAAHEVVVALLERFGDRMTYAWRHRPTADPLARAAAELAETVYEATGEFWPVHDALMRAGPRLVAADLERIAERFGVDPGMDAAVRTRGRRRVDADAESARRSGARVAPTFFVRERRYDGPWDESTLAQALLRVPSQRLQTASIEFVRWGPSTGLLLLVAFVVALAVANSPFGPAFERWWETPVGLFAGDAAFALPLRGWIDDALLSVFFLVVGLEIKRELTVGRLSTARAAALPIAAAVGGMILPALLYLLAAPAGAASRGWGVPIATDTAFALAVLVLLGGRVPVELRVFLTAAVIVDDLVAIAVVALFYTNGASLPHVAVAVAAASALVALNRLAVYRRLPYVVLGIVLWTALHQAGIHPTLAGVVLAGTTPVRPPPHLPVLLAQADAIIEEEMARDRDTVARRGLSDEGRRALDIVHDRIESPADTLLRSVEPWSSYLVLPVFALANAGVVVSYALARDHGRLILAIVLGLVLGKPVGMLTTAALAVWSGVADKPDAYSWRQLAGAGAVAGIGFTMSLFIAAQAFPDPDTFAAAKLGIFLASLLAGTIGVLLLRTRRVPEGQHATRPEQT